MAQLCRVSLRVLVLHVLTCFFFLQVRLICSLTVQFATPISASSLILPPAIATALLATMKSCSKATVKFWVKSFSIRRTTAQAVLALQLRLRCFLFESKASNFRLSRFGSIDCYKARVREVATRNSLPWLCSFALKFKSSFRASASGAVEKGFKSNNALLSRTESDAVFRHRDLAVEITQAGPSEWDLTQLQLHRGEQAL
jgi:hypothetical protein